MIIIKIWIRILFGITLLLLIQKTLRIFKAVLVGEYGTLIHDEHFSPADLGKVMPGVEFHANFLDALITGKFLRGLSSVELWSYSAVAALAGAAVFLFASVPVSVASPQ